MQQKMIQFSGDVSLPAIGQGTWYMGEDASQRKTEVAALRAGIELGLTLIVYAVSILIISISTYYTGLAVSLLKRLWQRWKN